MTVPRLDTLRNYCRIAFLLESKGGKTWTIKSLAEELGWEERTVHRYLGDLRSIGLITGRPDGKTDGSGSVVVGKWKVAEAFRNAANPPLDQKRIAKLLGASKSIITT